MNRASRPAVRPVLSGVARVYCVHDREKRQVTDPEHVKFLGLVAGYVYDPKIHKLHLCACCENLFVALDDTPRLCDPCVGPLAHPLGGPLPGPKGTVDG